MTPALVSVVIPVFNGERFLVEALESIVAQTYPHVEILVLDDGSTDGTAAIAHAWHKRARYVPQGNAGVAEARNHGVREAQGEFVAFLDADDRWHPEKLARQVARFHARPDLGVSVVHAVMFDEERGMTGWRDKPDGTPIPAYISGAMLVRARVFAEVGAFNPALHHTDSTDWFLRAAARGVEVELLPDGLLYRRLHAGNMSRLNRSRSFDEFLTLIKRTLDDRRRAGDPVDASTR